MQAIPCPAGVVSGVVARVVLQKLDTEMDVDVFVSWRRTTTLEIVESPHQNQVSFYLRTKPCKKDQLLHFASTK